MPRLQPAPGYITATEVKRLLDIGDAMLAQYVKRGLLHRYGPEGRKHLFYKLAEVEAVLASRHIFGEYQEALPATFGPATLEDIPEIVDIDERTFNVGQAKDRTREAYLQWLTPVYRGWFQKNPEAFAVLRDTSGKVIGYMCLLPIRREVIDRFVRDEIDMDSISPDDVEQFEPGRVLHVYVIALAIDPVYRQAAKKSYGSQMLLHLRTIFHALADRGVEIATITARSYKPDGLHLLRKMGIPQLRSPVPGKQLFAVNVAESGNPLFVLYTDRLAAARQGRKSSYVD
jgi:hypothetical protein